MKLLGKGGVIDPPGGKAAASQGLAGAVPEEETATLSSRLGATLHPALVHRRSSAHDVVTPTPPTPLMVPELARNISTGRGNTRRARGTSSHVPSPKIKRERDNQGSSLGAVTFQKDPNIGNTSHGIGGEQPAPTYTIRARR